MAEYIYTFTGRKFYPLSPRAEDIEIADIAHALSLLCRANGHFSSFHSVAQHSVECCNEALQRGYSKKTALACLLHDASEAYMSDVTTPVKNKLEFLKEVDPRIRIVWEDCGAFPFAYLPDKIDNFEETVDLTRRIACLS